MSFSFGSGSISKLNSVHPKLRQVAIHALARSPYDFSIIHGWRGEEVQNALEDSGASTKRFPDSRHNMSDDDAVPNRTKVSDAIDFAPYVAGQKIPWDETHIFAVIAGVMFAAAAELGVTLTWGGDWDGDANTKEHKLQDWGHLQIEHGSA